MCLNFVTPKMIYFPFRTNGKSFILGVPILKHITVSTLLTFYLVIFTKNVIAAYIMA